MNRALLVLLQALTLLDIGFVQATGAVDSTSLAAMWGLALGAPWLRRLQRYRAYRVGWNAGVLVAFAFLVQHATTSGLLHMLEDGLVLAVLCQVHLLNNVGASQPPDLLFFNSFLIVFVTGFFAPDASWALLFVAHAYVLVPALQMQAWLLAGGSGLCSPWRALRDGAARATCVLAATFAAFVLLPRDFDRAGWLSNVAVAHRDLAAGVGDRVRLDDEAPPVRSERILARIQPLDGGAAAVPPYWRTRTFLRFDGTTWLAQEAAPLGVQATTDPIWEQHADGSLRRHLPAAERVTLRVQLIDEVGARMPVPLAATLIAAAADVQLDGTSDGCVRLLPGDDAGAGALEFTVQAAAASGNAPIAGPLRAALTALPPNVVPDAAHQLVDVLRGQLSGVADARTRASATTAWLAEHRRYALPGSPGFARDFAAFLRGDGAGHCEFFATALALLLRLQGVPCRLVGGWLVHEREAATNSLVVRARHAHAWVEALDEHGRWHTFDATPPEAVGSAAAADAWWDRLGAGIAHWWATAAAFDASTQARWVAACGELLRLPSLAGLGALAGFGLLLWRRGRRAPPPPTVQELRRALRAAGVALRAGETPREVVRRAAAAGVTGKRLAALRLAAAAHERQRYQLI